MYPLKTNKKYDPNNLTNLGRIYSTTYLGNYIPGDVREYVWSHCWVDIIPTQTSQDVVACLDWVVFKAATNASSGNYVVIKHEWAQYNWKSTTLYSCYMHLSKFVVATGDTVSEGQLIGNTWNTGNSFWEHLHFQIDTAEAPFHPYWPYTTKEASDAWLGFMAAANAGLWLEKAKTLTVNPLVYLDSLSGSARVSNSTEVASNSWIDDLLGSLWGDDKKETHVDNSSSSIDSLLDSFQTWTFEDVPKWYAYYDAIEYMGKNWIVKWNNSKFLPENNISRVELLKIVFLAAKIEVTSDSWDMFTDVPAWEWFEPFVETAKRKWIVSGYEDWSFWINKNVTVAEAIKIILKSFWIDVVSTDPWYKWYIDYIQNKWIKIDDYSNQDRAIKRWEVANIVYKIMKK